MLTEEEIIKGCQKNDKNAQQALYKKFSSRLFGICLRYVPDKDDAADVLQESLIKIFQNITKFRNDGSFEGWLKRITVNTALNHLKKNKYQFEEIDFDDTTDVPFTENTVLSKLAKEEILKLLQELPEGKRVVFNLYVFEGYNHKEIGELLNVTESTSKTQYAKAKKILQEKITQLYI